MRRKIDTAGEKNIPTHVVAVFAFIQKGNKFLLAKRYSFDPQSGGEWSIPSGKVEIEEGCQANILLKTLKREIKEEVGLEIEDKVNYLGDGSFIRVSGHHVIAICFLCKWKSGKAEALEDQEEVRWLTLEELKSFKGLPDYTKERIKFLDNFLSSRK